MAGVPAWRPGPPSLDTIAMPEFRGLRGEHVTFVQYASGDLEFYDNARDPLQLGNAVCRLPAASVDALSAASAGAPRPLPRGRLPAARGPLSGPTARPVGRSPRWRRGTPSGASEAWSWNEPAQLVGRQASGPSATWQDRRARDARPDREAP